MVALATCVSCGCRLFDGLVAAIDSLSQFPLRCLLAPEDREFSFEVRHLLYGRRPHIYRILFTVEGDVAHVLHIRHGRRKPTANPIVGQ